jgi:hypothetical protein
MRTIASARSAEQASDVSSIPLKVGLLIMSSRALCGYAGPLFDENNPVDLRFIVSMFIIKKPDELTYPFSHFKVIGKHNHYLKTNI